MTYTYVPKDGFVGCDRCVAGFVAKHGMGAEGLISCPECGVPIRIKVGEHGTPGISIYFQPGYKPSLARFAGDPEANCQTESQWRKLIDKRKGQGWVQVDASDLHNGTGNRRQVPEHMKEKLRKPLLEGI